MATRKGEMEEDQSPRQRTAGWQKVLWIVGIVALIVLAVLLVTGDHGPGRHSPDTQQQERPDG